MLGGNGILLENHVIRHMADIESIHTYEGTESMQALLIGRDITASARSPDPRPPSALRSAPLRAPLRAPARTVIDPLALDVRDTPRRTYI